MKLLSKLIVGLLAAGSANAVRIEESDAAFCGGDGVINASTVEVTGTGYFNTSNYVGASMEWLIDGSAGSYVFTWSYTGPPGNESNRAATLYIDGEPVTQIDFFNTTLDDEPVNYVETSVTVDGVAAGLKNIQLSADTEFGLFSIDWIDVDGVADITAPNCCNSVTQVDINPYLASLDLDVPPIAEIDGWASVYGVSGGGNSLPIVVNTLRDLRDVLRGDCPRVGVLNASVDTLGNLTVGSNKTLIGAGNRGKLVKQKFQMTNVSNIILQNIDFSESWEDTLEARRSVGIQITQCSFHDSRDELLSIKRAADFVTVSFCHFYFEEVTEHAYAHLVGHSDGNGEQDRGTLHVTFHDNYYGDGVIQRQPRVRFGQVHVYNTYFSSDATTAVFGFGVEAQIRIENVYLEQQENVIDDKGGAELGAMGWRNMLSVDSEVIPLAPNTFPVFDVPYDYILKETSLLNEVAPLCAGVARYHSDICRAATRISTLDADSAANVAQISFLPAFLTTVFIYML